MTFEMLNNHSEILSRLARGLGKPCMFLSTSSENADAIRAAAPYLSLDQAFRLMANGLAVLVFNDEESMTECFEHTVGSLQKRWPNENQGLCNVYALTCDSTGRLQSGNT